MDDFKLLETAAEVMDALGGNEAIEILTGSKPSAVCNWRKFGKFPSNTFVAMTAALAKQRQRAPEVLWGMRRAAAEAAQ